MENRSERSRQKLEDRIAAVSSVVITLLTLIDHLPSRNRHNIWQNQIDRIKDETFKLRKLLDMKKHEQLPEWEMALAQTKRCLDAMIPEESDAILAKLALGPPRNTPF